MSQQLEIEFKNLLTKEEYFMLLRHFNITQERIHQQENHYFDTADFHLKKARCGLRIRVLPNKIECTLKERSSQYGYLETTDILTEDQAAAMIKGAPFSAPSVEQRLIALQIPIEQLQLFGSLTTKRVEIDYQDGILVFDHSFYLQCEDYEVEYETKDEKIGKSIFEKFLNHFEIEKRPTPKKIARFVEALKNQN